jgi:hypothetical protein
MQKLPPDVVGCKLNLCILGPPPEGGGTEITATGTNKRETAITSARVQLRGPPRRRSRAHPDASAIRQPLDLVRAHLVPVLLAPAAAPRMDRKKSSSGPEDKIYGYPGHEDSDFSIKMVG